MKAGADPNIAIADGSTCLHCAVFKGCSIDVLQILTDHGVDVNTLNKNGDTALLLASCKGNIGGINVLLKDGADPKVAMLMVPHAFTVQSFQDAV